MTIQKFHIYLADLNPRFGTEPGKTRPVVVVQTDLLNANGHPSTMVCPLTTKVIRAAKLLRVHVPAKSAGLQEPSDILVDQIRAIDNRRLIKHLGILPKSARTALIENLKLLILE